MQRISLAIALAGAIAVTGCGGNVSPSTGDGKGVGEGNFKVSIQNGQSGAVLAIKGGKVTGPGGIDCGEGGAGVCEMTFALGTPVALTAVPAKGKSFLAWGGDCSGTGACTLTGNADKYIVAVFGLPTDIPHATFVDPAVHASAFQTHALPCAECHGATLQGQGIAVACTDCHKASTYDSAGAITSATETCDTCHSGDGNYHQSIYNKYADATKLVATIDNVSVTDNGDTTFKTVVTFTLKNNGAPVTTLSSYTQKRYSATGYDAATKTFPTAKAFGFSAAVATATPGTYTVTAAKAPYNITTSNAFLYFYFGDATIIPPEGHYTLMDNVVSVGKVYGTIDWASTASVVGCQKCHGTPYQKHGYRQAVVPGLPDFMACKACHTDQRGGVDFNLAMTSEDPVRLAELEAMGATCGGELCWSAEDEATYAYTATTMADTHIAHAKEFLYPQSMASCATCHEGKLNQILTDANFTGNTCKTCHLYVDKAGLSATTKQAPLLAPAYHVIDWVKGVLIETDNSTVPPTVTEMQCNACHNAAWVAPWDGVTKAPLLADLHVGYDHKIYAANGTRFADVIKASITGATYDSATRELSIQFSITKTDPTNAAPAYGLANIVPQLMIGPYGFDTKDWAQSYFSQDVGGAKKAGVTLVTNGQTTGNWEIKVDLDAASATWAPYFTTGTLRRVEIGIRPWPVDSTTWAVLPAANPSPALAGPEMALNAVTRTFDLGAAAFADSFYAPIVDVAKCNKCHDALATTFHEATGEKNRGGSIVACRMCHTPRTAGSHLEMQSRSLDSYVHAIHSFQAFDIKNYNFADELSAFQYEHHTAATYPYFTTLACESCHNPGTYNPPANDKSLAGVLSASQAVTGKTRAIGGVPSVVTGPGSRACGGCHRAMFINADDAAGLSNFDTHTKLFGYREAASTLDAVIQKNPALK